ncbi:hypothetical protein B0I35DRAFT_411157 [Stachybotrys elegans]|uniref:Uncharacterized protein n=1 Tax=Stachybotrys elegans TaxID=80388 RepID=A0A8K0WPQ1_9HYPO|nr:hypothetical protein B0I35DRAFT_411157 [Stachybotrys elegans]
MAIRYSAELLLHLRESPLCIKPSALPPPEDWMGAPQEQPRTQTKTTGDRIRTGDNPLLDQTNRRPGMDRHVSRNSGNVEDIVFGPPRMAFASARGNKTLDGDNKESDNQRFNLRSRNGDSDADRMRDGRTGNSNPLRRRGEGEEVEGWSTVKPRKSFGHEGAERFHGRMGGNFRDERRTQNERDPVRDRQTRGLDSLGRDKDGDDGEGRPRNGSGRSKLDLWYRNEPSEAPAPERPNRADRNKSWRDREKDSEPVDDRNSGRAQDRRWGRDRDQRVEREPEWLDDPNENQREAHTQQDFQKWMEQMKKAKSNPQTTGAEDANEAAAAAIEAEKPAVQSAPAAEPGPDKFFMAFGGSAALDVITPTEPRDGAAKSKAAGKSSRFTSFFSQPHDEPRGGRTEPPTPLAEPPMNGFKGVPLPQAAAPPVAAPPAAAPPEEERQAFQQLLAKLQKQTMSATPPAPSPFAAPQQPHHGIDLGRKSVITSPESFHQYGEHRDGPAGRPPSQQVQEILAPRPQLQAARPEQLLQDLVGHHQRTSSQGSGRIEHGMARNTNNAEFLMNLMRAGPDSQQRNTPPPHMLRMGQQQQGPLLPQPQQAQKPMPGQMQMPPQLGEREPDYGRDARGPAQRQMRPQPPPGFMMDDSFHGGEHDSHPRPNQPTQILQRPPVPPGLDQMPPSWMVGGGQMPPVPPQQQPQQRGPMMPPPGLAGGPTRNVPPPHMFPPNFPPGAMPPPEVMGGMPPRNMPPPPPPGFFNAPPHGFMPPGMAGFNGPPGMAMDSHAFAGGPFEGRGMPPTGNPGRGAGYGRL